MTPSQQNHIFHTAIEMLPPFIPPQDILHIHRWMAVDPGPLQRYEPWKGDSRPKPHEAWAKGPLALVVCKADRPMQASKIPFRAHGSEIQHSPSDKQQSCNIH